MPDLVPALACLLHPVQLAVAAVLVALHHLGSAAGLDPAGGLVWSLAIVGLVALVRLGLLPLQVRAFHAGWRLRALAPRLTAVDERYRGRTDPASRRAAQEEKAAVLRDGGAHPVAGCLPVLAQAPVLLGLFSVLNGLRTGASVGALTPVLAAQANTAALFGAPLSSIAWGSGGTVLLVVALLVLGAALAQWVVVRAAGQRGPVQYVVPALVVVTSLHVPVGVLVYWLTTNVWSLVQQLVLTRRHPAAA